MNVKPEKIEMFSNIPDAAMNNIADGIDLKNDLSQTSLHIPDVENITTGSTESEGAKPNISIDKSVKTSAAKLGSVIGGELAVNLFDIAMPVMFVVIIRYVGYKIEKKDLLLTSKDKAVLIPAVQSALDAIEINFDNPFVNLSFIVSVIYGVKIIEAIPEMEKFTKPIKAKIIPINEPEQEPAKQSRRKEPLFDFKEPEITPTAAQVVRQMESSTPLKTELNLSPETQFKEELTATLAEIIKSGRRKSRSGAMGFLQKEEPQLLKDMLKKYGLKEIPEDLK